MKVDWFAILFIALIIITNLIGAINKNKQRQQKRRSAPDQMGPPAKRPASAETHPRAGNVTDDSGRPLEPSPFARASESQQIGPVPQRAPQTVAQRPVPQAPSGPRAVRQLPPQQPAGARPAPVATPKPPAPVRTPQPFGGKPATRRPPPGRPAAPPPARPPAQVPRAVPSAVRAISEEEFASSSGMTQRFAAELEAERVRSSAPAPQRKPTRLRFSDDDIVNGLIVAELLGRPKGMIAPEEQRYGVL